MDPNGMKTYENLTPHTDETRLQPAKLVEHVVPVTSCEQSLAMPSFFSAATLSVLIVATLTGLDLNAASQVVR